MAKIKTKIRLILISICLPFCAYAYAESNLANDVGNGTKEIVHGVGKGVEDLGTGVGDAVKDVGTGFGNAFSGKSHTQTATNNQAFNDAMSAAVQAKITELSNAGRISPGFNLQVTTYNGQTVISGFVTNENDIDTIYNEATKINSINTVSMSVTVKQPKAVNPPQ